MKRTTVFTIFVALVLFCVDSQSIKAVSISDICKSLNNLQNFSVQEDFRMVMPGNDSIKVSHLHEYQKNLNDTIVGYSFILKNSTDLLAYDGTNMITLNNESRNYTIINALTFTKAHLMISSPQSIKKILELCISMDSIKYSFDNNENGDVRMDIIFPFNLMDSYILNISSKNKGVFTKVRLLFDKQTLLPKSLFKEISSPQGKQRFVSYFSDYKTIAPNEINVASLIPSNYTLQNQRGYVNGLINKQLPELKLKTLDGKIIDLQQVKSENVVLEFSTLYCGACRTSTPVIIKILDSLELKANNFYVVDVQKNSNKIELDKYVSKSKIKFPYIVDGLNLNFGFDVKSFPTFIMLDKDKKIVDVMLGFNKDKFLKMIEKK